MTENLNPEQINPADFYIDTSTHSKNTSSLAPFFKKYGSLMMLLFGVVVLGVYFTMNNFKKPEEAADASEFIEQPVMGTQVAMAQEAKVEEFKESIAPGFPEFPVIPNATVDLSKRKNSEGKQGFVSVWKTESSVIEMVQTLKTELPNNGWTFVIPFEDSAELNENFAKIQKGNQHATVTVEREKEGQVLETKVLVEFPLQ